MQQLLSRTALHGLGSLSGGMGVSTNTIISSVTGTGAALSPLIASDVGLTALLGASVAIPIVGAAIAALGFGIEMIVNSGCGQPCIVSTTWANQAEKALQDNITAYFAIPVPRPASVQAAAMANWRAIWNSLVQQCNSPALGDPGQRCITDRQEGACKWHQTTTPPWGTPAQGECWNWKNGYYDPIANDPNVVPDAQLAAASSGASPSGPSTVTGTAATTANASASFLPSSLASISPTWILAAAAGLLLFGVMGGSD